METTSTTGKEHLPLSAHPRKLVRYAEILATGLFSCAEAARRAGYKSSTADKCAYAWLGKTREDSEYPNLWDYYNKLRKENLREFDIEVDTIARELALIAFSDVTRFVDLPSKSYEEKARLAWAMEEAVNKVAFYPDEVVAYQRDLAQYNRDCEIQDSSNSKGRKRKLIQPREPKEPTPTQVKLFDDWVAMNEEERSDLMFWKHYRAGSVRLKNREEIPAALTPCVAEISETKDGIRVKLYDKIGALDKLARFKKMYEEEKPEGEGGHVVKEINIIVNGSKSTLDLTGKAQEDKAA